MSLRFILGDGRCRHDQAVIEQAKSWLEKDHQEVFFLVPNYNKFEREREILQLLKEDRVEDFASIRAQVYSFHRLAWFYLQQTGLLSQNAITENGASMIMRKLLLELEEELVLYRGEINKAGFIQQLLAFYQEMHTSRLGIEDLLAGGAAPSATQDEEKKYSELAKIFQRFEQELLERALQVEQPITLLTRFLEGSLLDDSRVDQTIPTAVSLNKAPDLSHALFIISGFSAFSTQEQQLIQVLMKRSHVIIDLFLDRGYPQEMPTPLDLFYEAGRTYYQLISFARDNQVNIFLDQKLSVNQEVDKEDEGSIPQAYKEVETFWRQTQSQANYHQQTSVKDFLAVWKVGNPEEEIRQIAASIRGMMSDKKRYPTLRYRDIQLLIAEPEVYHQYIPKIFT
ncbi:PD-(D/E)XK nuclease family protein, partial [Enterococcus sp.]